VGLGYVLLLWGGLDRIGVTEGRLDPWVAGLLAGVGATLMVSGCGFYARAKGRHAGLGAALGAAVVTGWLVFAALPTFGAAALNVAALVALVALPDRHKALTQSPLRARV